jgi:small conductance mechanosensitive channel
VHLINIFNTVIKTGDNKTIFIPNGPLASGTIINYDIEDNRRVDMKFIINPTSDVTKAREIIYRIAERDTRVLKDPAPKVAISETSATSVTLLVRVWAHHTDYWDVFYTMQEHVKNEFHKENIF